MNYVLGNTACDTMAETNYPCDAELGAVLEKRLNDVIESRIEECRIYAYRAAEKRFIDAVNPFNTDLEKHLNNLYKVVKRIDEWRPED